MYELDGQEYSLEEIQKAAEESNLTVEEYIQQTGIVKKQAVAEDVADVTAVNEQIATGQSTDLGSGDISLDLSKINNINKRFSKDKDGVTTDQTPLTETQVVDLTSYIDELEKEVKSDKSESEIIQSIENISNVKENLPGQLKGTWEDIKAQGLKFIQEVAGDDAADFITGESIGAGAIAYIDPETNEEVLFKNNPEKWKQLSDDKAKAIYSNTKKEVGSYADEAWINMVKKSQQLAKEQKDIGGGFVKGFKEGDVSDLIGASFNAVGGVISTMVPAVLTRGISLAPQISAPMITDYNVEKAKALYGDVDDALDQLQNNEQIDLITPAILSSFAVAAEYFGLKNIGKIISRQAWNYRGLANTAVNVSVNGWQEQVQFGLETVNKSLAEGFNVEDAITTGINSMASDEGIDAFLSGVVGSAVVGGGGNKALRALRNDSNGVNIVNSSINRMHALTLQKNGTKDKRVKALIEEEIQNTQSKLKTYLETNQKLSTFLTEEQRSELIGLIDKKDKLYNDAIDLRKSNQNGDLSNKEYGYAIRSINNQAKKIDTDIQLIKKNINVEQVTKDIETAKKVGEKLGYTPEVLNSEQFKTRIEELEFSEQEKNEALLSEGFITPDGQVLINKDRAVEVGAIGVGSHELLHRIIRNDLSDPVRRKEIVDNFKDQLSQKELNIVQKRIDDNYRFNEDGTEKSESEYNEEYLTAFSDALRSGEISYEKTLFEKLAEPILKIFRPKGFTKASFKDGKDVYNFLKEYQRELAKGKLTERAERLTEVKQAGEVKTKLSKTIVAENKRLSEQLKTATAQEAVDIKNDLALNNEGIVNDFVNSKFKSGLGITKDEFKSGVQEEVLVYLNKTYDPSKGEYGAYIREGLFGGGKFGGGRLGNILRRLGQEGDLFTKEIDDRTTPETLDITTEEVTERVAEKPTKAKESLRKKIKLDKATTQKVIDAVVKTFGTKLPPVDSPKFKKALQKAFRTELKTTIAKDVLGSRAAYETFLRDNFENIYEAIPQDIINKRFRPFAEDTGKREQTKEGKKIFKKKDITKAEFIKYFLGRDVGTSTKGTRKDALAEALAEEFAFDATMETIQKPEVIEKREFVDKTQTTEKVSKAIKRPVGLKFSKSQKQVEINEEPMKLLQALEKYERNKASMNKEELDLVEDFVAKAAIAEADKGKGAQQYTKAIKNSELNEDLKQGNWTLSDAKFKEDKKAIKEFNDQAQDLSSQVPILNNVKDKYQKVILGLFAGHYNIVGSEMAKVGSSFKQGIINNLNTKTKSVLSKETLDRWKNFKWENLETSYASKFKTALNKIYKANNLKEQIKIARETFNNKQGKASLELYDLWNTTMQEWLYSSEQGSKDFNKKADYILKLKKANAAIGTSGERILAPAGYVFLPGIIKEGTIKFEHLKSSSQQSFESAVLVLQGNWKKQGKQNLKAYNGIWGFLNDFNIIDDATGKVNDSNIFRFAENLELAKNIYSIKSDFTKTLYEDIVSKIGKKSVKEFEKNQKDINTFNKNILPKNIKYSKPETNQNVLNDMERLDTEAQEARIKFSKSKNLNKDFNDILERATGIGTEKRYGRTKARAVGADKGRFDLLGIPPSAQDFVGLTRYFAGKGKKGDETIAWVKENFLDPFARANIDISNARVALANDFKALKNLLGVSPKDLNKKITGEPYTVGNAVRVYTWSQQGMTIPGLSKADQKILEDYVTADENLITFANELIAINKDNGYPKPTEGWLAGTITTDLLSGLNTVVRAKYLKQWQNNVNEVFSETNMNKLEAAYGKGYREALENMLGRMKTGTNRGFKGDTLTGRFIDWINNSVGAIMFFNMRSAVLQTISAVNFVNWSDNNPLKASAAFANQPQYWKDVMKLMNSDYLVERRNGLKINVSEADIAEIAAESKNKAKAFISKILKLGFLPTQIADSFAIASGGATFYRNRYKSLKKEGLSDKEAEAQAFQDFREIAEESQQSSRPDRISQQQAGPMGRIILAFANTPAQYARLMQKAASDLKNRRGDDKTNISKILYYGAIQNVIFNALQQALFAMAFGDEEPDEEKLNKKYTGIANGMADSLLRGIGFHGAAVSTLKNAIMKLAEGKEAQDAAIELLDISPPISSKIGKLKSAGRTWDWNKKEIMEKGWSLDNPAYLAAGQVISAATNVPLDRGIRKLTNLKDASDAENEEWMRIANALGWAKWELEWQKDKPKKKSKSRSRSRSKKRR